MENDAAIEFVSKVSDTFICSECVCGTIAPAPYASDHRSAISFVHTVTAKMTASVTIMLAITFISSLTTAMDETVNYSAKALALAERVRAATFEVRVDSRGLFLGNEENNPALRTTSKQALSTSSNELRQLIDGPRPLLKRDAEQRSLHVQSISRATTEALNCRTSGSWSRSQEAKRPVNQIDSNSHQHLQAIEQIANALGSMEQTTQQTAAGESQAGALGHEAQSLELLVGAASELRQSRGNSTRHRIHRIG